MIGRFLCSIGLHCKAIVETRMNLFFTKFKLKCCLREGCDWRRISAEGWLGTVVYRVAPDDELAHELIAKYRERKR